MPIRYWLKRPRFLLLLLLLLGAALPASSTQAANPSSGTLDFPLGANLAWTGTAVGTGASGGESACVEWQNCDTFTLTVSGYPFNWNGRSIAVQIAWSVQTDDYDLYIHKDSNSGALIAVSANSSGLLEAAVISPSSSGVGVYTIHVVYAANTPGVDQYRGTAIVRAQAPGGAGLPPRYQNYTAPNGIGLDAGEPSIGVDWKSGRVMYQAGGSTLRVSFDDCSSPAQATWEEKTPPGTRSSLDPLLFCDSALGRTFVSQLTGQTNSTSLSDNDGESWTASQTGVEHPTVDHTSLGGGPYAPGYGLPLPLQPYTHAVYFCSADTKNAFCARSDDGGQTANSPVPLFTNSGCGPTPGRVKVAPDGTVYVPNRSCSGKQAVAVSTDNGLTWTVRFVTNSTATANLVDPSVGIAADGALYFGYQNADGTAHIAVSHDRGTTWGNDQDVGINLNLRNTTFPAVVAGDPNRAAFAFLGTTAGGNYQDSTLFKGEWHLYIASTFDGGLNWLLVDATPNDPVQRGSICNQGVVFCAPPRQDRNLLDFIDMTGDAQGRVLVAYADGCISSGCVGGIPDQNGQVNNDFAARATLARQAGGRRLLAAFDPVEPSTPAAPQLLSAARNSTGSVHLTWTVPDTGAAPLTAYNIYRSSSATAGFVLIATIPATKPAFEDPGAGGAAVYYRVTASNASGEGPYCGSIAASSAPESPCVLPGVTILTDASYDETDGNPAHDIQRLAIAEPYFPDGSSKLVVTLKVASLATLPPSSTWPVYFTPPLTSTVYFVQMQTGPTGAVNYAYGTGSASENVKGPLAAGSGYAPDGTITLILTDTLAGNPQPGQALTRIYSRVGVTNGSGSSTPDSAPDDLSNPSPFAYVLSGNGACRPNGIPVSVLTVNPISGTAPLQVNFNANYSFDPDSEGLTFTFDFGDGNAISESGSFTSHIYPAPGEYRATLRVADSQGAGSIDIAQAVVEVDAPPAPRRLVLPILYQANSP